MHKNNDQAGQQAPIQSAELVAQAIYALFPGADAHPWVENGNSFKQTLAREYARAALAAVPAQQQASTVPAGWRLVPITAPTYMLQAMRSVIEKPYNPATHALMYKERRAYTALLDSAPQPPVAPAHALTDAEIDEITGDVNHQIWLDTGHVVGNDTGFHESFPKHFARAIAAHLARKG